MAAMSEYLTTRELADLLRIKERKVYDLAASGSVPCVRATGKLLFPRQAIDDWLGRHRDGAAVASAAKPASRPPRVVLGSHDPLLEWALRQSGCGLASYFDGSADGLERFAQSEGLAAGLHLRDDTTGDWNVPAVAARFADRPVVLVEWARRRRGFVLSNAVKDRVAGFSDLRGLRVTPRQPASGAQMQFLRLLADAGLTPEDLEMGEPARTEADAALSVLDGKADIAFGLQAEAAQYKLAFLPVAEERFDLLVDRREWFEPPMQAFLAFCRSPAFATKAGELAGYDISGFGIVHFNGAA